ncbi:hypothetical protein GCE9029_03558 [Grimontia celer]|uniref:Uncharacterized protein n=1 Tax=Grimontia celer TaxID=1796497 RepID=A0A128F8A7_9GAMM|nr:hypothetical protein [Grimontia celer]CZF82978.1 hypothetical protein GCE9029_03558 [Grimontia celer]
MRTMICLPIALALLGCGGGSGDSASTSNGGSTSPEESTPSSGTLESYSLAYDQRTFIPLPMDNKGALHLFAGESSTFTATVEGEGLPEHEWTLKEVSTGSMAVLSESQGDSYIFMQNNPGEFLLTGCADKSGYDSETLEGFEKCINVAITNHSSDVITLTTDKDTDKTVGVDVFSDLDLKFVEVEQPNRGQLIVNQTRNTLTYRPLNHYDYLMDTDEAETQKVAVRLEGSGEVIKRYLNIEVNGTATLPTCHDGNSILIAPANPAAVVTVDPDQCVELDAAAYGENGYWDLLKSPLDSFLIYAGLEEGMSVLRFKYPQYGDLHFMWCYDSNDCESDTWQVASSLTDDDVISSPRLENLTSQSEETVSTTITRSVQITNEADYTAPDPITYEWSLTDSTYAEHRVLNLLTSEKHLDFDLPDSTRNFKLEVRAINGAYQDEYFGNTAIGYNVSQYIYARGDRTDAPTAIVRVNGEEYNGETNKRVNLHVADAKQVSFDASSTIFKSDNPFNRSVFVAAASMVAESTYQFSETYTHDLSSGQVQPVTFCAQNDYSWTYVDNSCITFIIYPGE